MQQRPRIMNLGEYLTVKKAASLLGVSTKTLRNWDRSGKLKPRRHPVNGYRLYRSEELQALLEKAASAPDGGPL
jgi:MerR family transcriptional regulator, copper efflux regulator